MKRVALLALLGAFTGGCRSYGGMGELATKNPSFKLEGDRLVQDGIPGLRVVTFPQAHEYRLLDDQARVVAKVNMFGYAGQSAVVLWFSQQADGADAFLRVLQCKNLPERTFGALLGAVIDAGIIQGDILIAEKIDAFGTARKCENNGSDIPPVPKQVQ